MSTPTEPDFMDWIIVDEKCIRKYLLNSGYFFFMGI